MNEGTGGGRDNNVGNNVSRLETEAERAERHKAALAAALGEVVKVAEAARRDGFYIEFGVNLNQFGQYTIQPAAALLKRF